MTLSPAQIPDSIRTEFEYLIRIVPTELREDHEFLKSSLVYLKLGGERLARQFVAVTVMPFCEDFDIVRRRPDLEEAEASGQDEDEKEEEEEESEPDDTDGL